MKPRLIFYLALAVIGASWIAFIRSEQFAHLLDQWQRFNIREGQRWLRPIRMQPPPVFAKKNKIVKTLKVPWRDATVWLLRPNGETLELNAKRAVYSVRIDHVPPDSRPHKSFDYYAVAFIDPATRNIYVGEENSGMVDTNEGFATTQTNFFFETDSGIFSGDSALWQGNFDCGESFIDKAGPGEDLNDVIAHFDRLENIFIGTFWTVPLRDYFRDEFFARFGFEGSTQIQSERIVRGRLELDFNSYRYETKGSVWLDLGTFVVRDAVEYRPIRFDTVSLLWGLAPALAAVLTLLWTAFIVRKARKPIHYVISGMVLAMEADALHLLYEMYIVGAWSDYFFIFRHFFVPGEWSAYLPMAYVGCAFLITSMQALLLYNHKRS